MATKERVTYWVTTVGLASGLIGSGVQQLLRVEGEGAWAPPYAWGMEKLGYPVYVLTILGIWKLLGAAALLAPRYPLLKEWAYAGIFFLLTGAVFSHVAVGHPWYQLLPALFLLVFTVASWHFRPPTRRLAPSAEKSPRPDGQPERTVTPSEQGKKMSQPPKKKNSPKTTGFSAQERAAVQQRAAELRTQANRGPGTDKAAADEADVLTKIAEMPDPDRAMAERFHAIVTAAAPELSPRLYYGQPGYARKGKVVCFFRSGLVDKERYSTVGFSNQANLDDSTGLWPTSYALTNPTEAAWTTLTALITQAAT